MISLDTTSWCEKGVRTISVGPARRMGTSGHVVRVIRLHLADGSTTDIKVLSSDGVLPVHIAPPHDLQQRLSAIAAYEANQT